MVESITFQRRLSRRLSRRDRRAQSSPAGVVALYETHSEMQVGRSFFYNAGRGLSTWKPPRGMKSPEQVERLMSASAIVDSGYVPSEMSSSSTSASFAPPFSPPPAQPSTSRSLHVKNRSYGASPAQPSGEILKAGPLQYARSGLGGKKVKKVWTLGYAMLSPGLIIAYKDEEDSKKKGAHYSAPQAVFDLRSARIAWKESKERRRVNRVFILRLHGGEEYAFAAPRDEDANAWFDAVQGASDGLLLQGSPPPSPSKFRGSLRSRLDATSAEVTESPGHGGTESRATILEKLRKLFRSRPTLESLQARGIYKPEPVFGSSLMEIAGREHSSVPRFIREVTEQIEARGLEADGLYRISGNLSQIQKIRCQVDQEEYGLLVGEEDIHVLSGALKLFFRELQEPLFPPAAAKDFLAAIKLQGPARIRKFQELLKRLPPPHLETLRCLLLHLRRVADHSSKNRMQIHNLAIVFGPTLFTAGGGRAKDKKEKEKKKKTSWRSGGSSPSTGTESAAFSSNSHLAFNMIMQGQIVEFLLKETPKLFSP